DDAIEAYRRITVAVTVAVAGITVTIAVTGIAVAVGLALAIFIPGALGRPRRRWRIDVAGDECEAGKCEEACSSGHVRVIPTTPRTDASLLKITRSTVPPGETRPAASAPSAAS